MCTTVCVMYFILVTIKWKMKRSSSSGKHYFFFIPLPPLLHPFIFPPTGSRSISGSGPGDASWILQRHSGRQRRRSVVEEGHLQGDLQAGQWGSWGLQISQLPTRTSPRLTRTEEDTRKAWQTFKDCEKTVERRTLHRCRGRVGWDSTWFYLKASGRFEDGHFWSALLNWPSKYFIKKKIFLFNEVEGSDSWVRQLN